MSEHMGSPSRWKKLNDKQYMRIRKRQRKGLQWDENGWCRETFNVSVRPEQRKGYRVAGPIELSAHDEHWYFSIDHAEYLLGQLDRAIKRAKATSASSSPPQARKRAVREGG